MTANAMDSDRKNCFEAGMDGYLSKPVRIEALEAELVRSSENIGQVVDFSVLSRFGEMTGSGSEAVRELVEIFSEETPLALQQIRATTSSARHVAGHQHRRRCSWAAPARTSARSGCRLSAPACRPRARAATSPLASEFVDRLEAEFEIVKTTLEEFARSGAPTSS